jgi:hypothetical protein
MGKSLEGSGRGLPEVLFRYMSGETDVECETSVWSVCRFQFWVLLDDLGVCVCVCVCVCARVCVFVCVCVCVCVCKQ